MNDTRGPEVFLLSFKTRGIKNIKEMMSLEFYKSTITKDFDRKDYNIKAIYGENGVGKSAIITSMKIYRDLLINNRYLKSDSNQDKLAYLLNKTSDSAFFETEYLYKNEKEISIYKFGIEIKKRNSLFDIVHEYCYRRSVKGNYKLLYESKEGELNIHIDKAFDKYAFEESKNMLKESSFLSLVITELTSPIFKKERDLFYAPFFCHISTYVYLDEKDEHHNYIFNASLKKKMENSEELPNANEYINTTEHLICSKKAVILKTDLKELESIVENLERFIRIFKPELNKIEIDKREDKDTYVCEFYFKYDDYRVHGEFESTGIKKLVELHTAFAKVDTGSVVFVDELDANIHDYYLCKLLEFVGEYSNGQLCFTTHNLGPMKVLKKYRKSIDFISRDGSITPWIKNGNYDVSSLYSKGLIDKSPFNLEAFDFLEVFGEV